MNEEELHKVLEKYYEGESTIEEELALNDYFNKVSAVDDHEAEKALFHYFRESKEVPEPLPDFEHRIIAGVDQYEQMRAKGKRFLFSLLSGAAGILLMVATYLFFVKENVPQDTFDDPRIAYAETIKILHDISTQLNYGAKVLEPVSRINKIPTESSVAFNKSTKLIEENIKNLENLNQLNKATTLVNINETEK